MKYRGKPCEDRVLEQAAYWYAENRDKNFSEGDREKLQAWLAENEKHQIAFDEIQQTSLLVSELFPQGSRQWNHALNGLVSTRHISYSATDGRHGKSTGRLIPLSGWQGVWKPAVAMAAMIVVVISISVFMNIWPQHSQIAVQTFHTAIGEIQEVVLKDGSIMKLNTSTMATAKFSSDQRLVELSGGEAFFDVVRDKSRPFLVRALGGEARALGTAFNVRNRCGKVMVAVAKGQVCVRKLGTRENKAILSADQWVSYSKGEGLGKVQTGLKCALAWQEKKLAFYSEPLSDVLKQVEAYYPVRLKLADPSLAKECLTGTFENRSRDEILTSIQTAFDLKAMREDGVIILTKRK
jgi:transmembrane sensor